MAERRMFTDKITESDAFLDMPLSTQAIYFHFCMNADDDGFVKNPKRIQKMLGASEDDCKLLILKRFILPFDSGVIVIKHWRMHNLLRKDRYKPTEYIEEKAMLKVKENGAYTFNKEKEVSVLATKCQPIVNQLAPQDSIGKVSIDKDRDVDYIDNETVNMLGQSPTTIELLKLCPNLQIDCLLDERYSYDEFLKKIKESKYLQLFRSLRELLNKYDNIMADKYKDFPTIKQKCDSFKAREYTQEELNSLFDNPDEVNL